MTTSATKFEPIYVTEVDLGHPLPNLRPYNYKRNQKYSQVLALARLHQQPLGVVSLDIDQRGLSAAAYAACIWRKLHTEILNYLQRNGLPKIDKLSPEGIQTDQAKVCLSPQPHAFAAQPLVSIIIATHNRTESLSRTLNSLLALDYPHYEIIVVDNAPGTDTTACLVQQLSQQYPHIHYLREDEPGLAIAHNCGLKQAKGSIVAITDDDVVVDKHWLTAIAQAFTCTDNVACVTGMIFPAELETPAQMLIEQYGGFNKGFTQRIFDLDQYRVEHTLYPYTAGVFGSGANMSFRTDILRRIGGFDPALGAGSKALGGDDLAIFFDIITHGYRLVYEPAAIVHHWHRREISGLQKQAFGYGVSLTAYLTKTIMDNPGRLFDFTIKMPQGLVYGLSTRSPKNKGRGAHFPSNLTWAERRGMVAGPLKYWKSRRYVRSHGLR